MSALSALKGTVMLAGAGKMGGALLSGWLAQGLDPKRVAVIDPHLSDEIRALAASELGVALGRVSAEGVRLLRAAGLDWPDAFMFCRLMFWRIVGYTTMELNMQTSSAVARPAKRQPHADRPTRFESNEEFPVDAPPRELARATKLDLDAMYEIDIDVFLAGVRSRRRSARGR